MLRTKAIAQVLEQSVQGTEVISSIVTTKDGQALSSFSRSKVPPAPKTNAEATITQPYKIDRTLKIKICSVFGSLVWEEYTKAAGGEPIKFITLETGLAQWVIRPIKLEASDDPLLLVIVAERTMAPGLLCKLSEETAKVLTEGLKTLTIA